MADPGGKFSFFHVIHVTFDTRIDISISIRPMITKAITSMGDDSNETNQVDASEDIKSRLRDFEKTS